MSIVNDCRAALLTLIVITLGRAKLDGIAANYCSSRLASTMNSFSSNRSFLFH